MIGALLIVVGIAVVDSLNPATVGPALALAVSSKPVARVLQFAAGVFIVNLLGGALLVLGPGRLLLALIPHASAHRKHVLELGAGIALLVAAVCVFIARERLARAGRQEPATGRKLGSGSTLLAGAGLALVELPTAFPYFAAIAAIEVAHLSVPTEVLLLVIFNLVFLLPVFAVAVAIGAFPSLRESVIEPLRAWMTRHWPRLLAVVLALGGTALTAVGAIGLRG